ncbi:MAG: DUF4870 domain-containing protein [Candidatus Pacearchaeota archaeon]
MSKSKKETKTELNIDENLEALLCYVLGWITGIVFLVLEKKSKFVKFHAIQSIIVFGFLTLIFIIFSSIPFIGWFIFAPLISVFSIIIWIISMIKAYNYEWFKWSIAGDIAEKNI